jgi:hypothetical protein
LASSDLRQCGVNVPPAIPVRIGEMGMGKKV